MLRDFGLNENNQQDEGTAAAALLNMRDKRDFNNFDDELDMLKLDDGFS